MFRLQLRLNRDSLLTLRKILSHLVDLFGYLSRFNVYQTACSMLSVYFKTITIKAPILIHPIGTKPLVSSVEGTYPLRSVLYISPPPPNPGLRNIMSRGPNQP